MWREANGMEAGEKPHPTAPGVTVKETSDLPEGAVIMGE